MLTLDRMTTTGMCWHVHFRHPDKLPVAQHSSTMTITFS